MTLAHFLDLLRQAPLVPSVQADPGTPLDDTPTLLRQAQSCLEAGARVLRLGGQANIETIKAETGAIVIGLIKRRTAESQVYITPTMEEVELLIASGCEAIGLDCTLRPRPEGARLGDLIRRIHEAGRLVVADCDTLETMAAAADLGADILSSTLSGYTEDSFLGDGSPDLDLVRRAADRFDRPVMAEGRYAEPWQAQAALRAGAVGVVIGAAITDAGRLATRFARALAPSKGPVGAVDLGGTWLRFARFSADWRIESLERIQTPASSAARLEWIRAQIRVAGVERLGVASGGTIDPSSGRVVEARPLIPDHVDTVFDASTLGVPCLALNDGLATAWGHACLPDLAGRRVLTLAIGTGVGAGLVDRHAIWPWREGAYPHLNDLLLPGGRTLEESLGGASGGVDQPGAMEASLAAIQAADSLYLPDAIVISGAVGLELWNRAQSELESALPEAGGLSRLMVSPFSEHSGLFGAAALALWPPNGLALR